MNEETDEERLLRKARQYAEEHTATSHKKRKEDGKGHRTSSSQHEEGHSDARRSSRGDGSHHHRKRKKGRDHDEKNNRHDASTGTTSRGEERRTRSHRDKKSDMEHRREDSDSGDNRQSSRKEQKNSSSRKDSASRSKRDDCYSNKQNHKKRRSTRHEKDGDTDNRKRSSRKQENRRSTDQSVNRTNLSSLGPIATSPPTTLLDVDADYFAYHQHLRLFLYRNEGVYFEDLLSSEAREFFAEFCNLYNDGKLEEAYYNSSSLPIEALEQCKRTKHHWNFRTNETEKKSLDMVKEGVRKQTEYESTQDELIDGRGSRVDTARAGLSLESTIHKNEQQHVASAQYAADHRRKTKEEIIADRTAHRRLRDHARNAEEEMGGGRKDGRERQIEKRRERSTVMHGAAKDREDLAMGGVELDDSAIYGEGSHGDLSYHNALAAEKRRKSLAQEKRTARVMELQAKEEDKQAALLKMLGLTGIQPGQKITIAPRKDD